MVIHRITGDGPKSLLIAPEWSGNKKMVLNYINRKFDRIDLKQGSNVTSYSFLKWSYLKDNSIFYFHIINYLFCKNSGILIGFSSTVPCACETGDFLVKSFFGAADEGVAL